MNSIRIGPSDILIDLDDDETRPPGPKSDDAAVGGSGFSFEDESASSTSLDCRHSMARYYLKEGDDTSEHSSLDDSVNGSTLTTRVCNSATKLKNPSLVLLKKNVTLNIDRRSSSSSSSEKSYPLCGDDSPSCSSEYQIQSPSLHTLLDDTGGATLYDTSSGGGQRAGSSQEHPPRTLFHHEHSQENITKESAQESGSPAVARNSIHAVHRRTMTADESPPSWSRRKLFFPRRRPATPPKRSSANKSRDSSSPSSSSSRKKSPLKDSSIRSRNSYPPQAASPAHAQHRRTNQPPATPK